MTGIELSRAFFEECGMPMLEEQFPDLLPFLAAAPSASVMTMRSPVTTILSPASASSSLRRNL